jgi:hypothetical protein
MALRTCRICSSDLENLYYVCGDKYDVFYHCTVCDAINPLRRPPNKPVPRYINEWHGNFGTVTLAEVPLPRTVAGYHAPHRDGKSAVIVALEKIEAMPV